MSNALWGHEFDRKYPIGRWIIYALVMIIGLILIWLIELVRNYQREGLNKLRQTLRDLTEDLTVDSEAKTGSLLEEDMSEEQNESMSLDEKEVLENNDIELEDKKKKPKHIFSLFPSETYSGSFTMGQGPVRSIDSE